MHLCPEELGPLVALYEHLSLGAKFLWYKLTWWRS